MRRALAIGIAAAVAVCALQTGAPPVEASGKKQPRSTSAQNGGDGKGVAWISGSGGVRGSGKAKGKKAR